MQAEEIKAGVGQQANDFCPAEGVFIAMGTAGSTEIARQMGAELTEKGNIKVNENMETTIPGLYAAGDCTGGLRWRKLYMREHRQVLMQGSM